MNIQTIIKNLLIAATVSLNILAEANAQECILTPQTHVSFDIR